MIFNNIKLLIYFFLLISLPINLYSQVARITIHPPDLSLKQNQDEIEYIYLFGPENVSHIFPGQAETYIKQYENYRSIILSNIQELDSDLKRLQGKKIRNKNSISKKILALNFSNLQVELLSEYIMLWEYQFEQMVSFQETIEQSMIDSFCLEIIYDGEKFQNTDFIIGKKSPSNRIENYHEFIDSNFIEITLLLNEEGMKLYESQQNLYSTLNNSDYSYFDLVEKNYWLYGVVSYAPFEGMKLKLKRYDKNQEDIEEIFEAIYSSFIFNYEGSNLIREQEVEFPIWYIYNLKIGDEIIFPEDWELVESK